MFSALASDSLRVLDELTEPYSAIHGDYFVTAAATASSTL
jgi:hypothetical protein